MKLSKITLVRREDFGNITPNKEIFITYHLVTDNRLLFGNKDNIYEEVFPRIKMLKKDLLAGVAPNISIKYDFTFSLQRTTYDGKSYSKDKVFSYGDSLIKIRDLIINHVHYRNLLSKFNILYGVRTNNGTIIGPDAGIIIGAKYIAEINKNYSVRIAEIGAGPCSTPIALCDYKTISFYYGFDFSPNMKNGYDQIFQHILEEKGIKSKYEVASAMECELPSNIDILSVGIYYEMQYDFLKKRGREIKEALNENGMIILQSGLPENLMFNDMLVKSSDDWPWIDKEFNLKNIFANIMQVNIEDEIMTIATHNSVAFYKLVSAISMNYNILGLY